MGFGIRGLVSGDAMISLDRVCITAGGEVNERTSKGYEGTGAVTVAVGAGGGGGVLG